MSNIDRQWFKKHRETNFRIRRGSPEEIEKITARAMGAVTRHVTKRIVRGATHPTTAPYADGSRHWTPPDSGLIGV
jgi:hypothetical protein